MIIIKAVAINKTVASINHINALRKRKVAKKLFVANEQRIYD